MKKTVKVLFIIFLLILSLQKTILATTTIDTNINIGNTPAINSSNSAISKFVGTFQALGTVIAVIALIIIGFRYMLSSIEEKAEMKGVIGYYIVGAIMVFGTTNFVSILYSVISNIK